MEYYPLFLDIKDRPCLVVGGGDVASRKAASLSEAGANVTILAPEFSFNTGGINYLKKEFEAADLEGFYMVIAATSDEGTNSVVREEAKRRKILVNVVDNRELSDFIVPSVVDRDPLLIAISTSGIAPYLSKIIRKDLEKRYPSEYSKLLDILFPYRHKINAFEDVKVKLEVWEKLFSDDFLRDFVKMSDNDIASHIERILDGAK